MSYRQSVSKTIQIHYSGSVSYPASEHGGTVSYSGTASELVTVNIDVETDEFDHSVAGCNKTIDLLTGAVAATNSAQVASISQNAEKVGQTIIRGFFKTISSELSQQIMELSTKLESLVLTLRHFAERCAAKQQQMEVDYNRIASRYVKVFNDLNKELENRVYELDRPAFTFKRSSDTQTLRSTASDLVGTAAVSSGEAGLLQAQISASITKKRALDTINAANGFLAQQKCLEQTITRSMVNESSDATIYVPVLFIETEDQEGYVQRDTYHTEQLPTIDSGNLIVQFNNQRWREMDRDDAERVRQYLVGEINRTYVDKDSHTTRIREMIARLAEQNRIKSCIN
ncbi:MAG: hypothetical protein IKK27_02645 [Alistipes sp.]|nr:hypothetical protein [Rikenellaceae bacterium]MBR3792823.1 hypothetical protein [Alistipes sp.]